MPANLDRIVLCGGSDPDVAAQGCVCVLPAGHDTGRDGEHMCTSAPSFLPVDVERAKIHGALRFVRRVAVASA